METFFTKIPFFEKKHGLQKKNHIFAPNRQKTP